jgi:hypothetical protein
MKSGERVDRNQVKTLSFDESDRIGRTGFHPELCF